MEVSPPPVILRSGLCPAAHAHPWPARDTALSFPKTCGPSSVEPCARRIPNVAFVWHGWTGTCEDENVSGKAWRTRQLPCTCPACGVRVCHAARGRQSGCHSCEDEP